MTQPVDITTAAADPPLPVAVDEPVRRGPGIAAWLTKPLTLRLLSLAVVLALWQLIGRNQPYSLSSPSAIATAGWHDFAGQVVPAFRDTLWGFFLGFLVCIVVGVPFGLLMARLRVLELALVPYVSALYATPRLAIIPVLILWLGISFKLRLAVTIVSGLFPILLNTYIGGKEVDRNLIEVGTAFAAGRARILKTIVFPGSLPYVFAGVRIGLGRALIGIIVAEIETSVVGVGNLISVDAQTLHIADMWVPIICLGIFSIGCSVLLKRSERWATMPWTRSLAEVRWLSRR